MNDYKERIKDCVMYLNSVRFPCEDWIADKAYFDQLEKDFSQEPADAETKALLDALRKIIDDKRSLSLRLNKTAEELFAGWDE